MRTKTLLVTSLLVACGAVREEAPTEPTPDVTADTPMLFAARDPGADTLGIVAIDPTSGRVSPWGASLPGVKATTDEIRGIAPSADGKRVLVHVQPKGGVGTWLTFLGNADGAFSVIARSATAESVTANRDLSLFWRGPATCDGRIDPSLVARLVTAEGAPIFETPCCLGEDADRILLGRMLLDGSGGVFVAHGTDVVIRTRDGAARTIKRYPKASQRPFLTVHRIFRSSVIVQHEETIEWIDFEGRTLGIPGLDSLTQGYSSRGYVVNGTELGVLADRAILPIQRVPSGTTLGNVVATAPGRFAVVTTNEGTLQTIGVSGEVMATVAPEDPRERLSGGGNVMRDSMRWVVATYFVSDRPQSGEPMLARGEKLLRFDANGRLIGSTVLRRLEGEALGAKVGGREYRPSESGARLIYADGEAFHRLDVATGEDRVLETPFRPSRTGEATRVSFQSTDLPDSE